MAFRLQDLCKTTRRASGNGLPRLFPRVLDDDRLDPRLGIALRFFETHLGRPRHEFDAEALVTLFGDPRLARGLVRCLSRTYRYRTRPLADVLGGDRAAALAARGLSTPAHLRALAERLSFIILAHPELPGDIPAALTVMPCGDHRLAALLDAYLECLGVGGGHDVRPEWLAALADAARAAGSLAESDLARRLDCPEDEVGLRLTPATDAAGDLIYVEGFGLCTAVLLGQARALIHEEMSGNRGRLELARLGRRLRGLVGRNEGLHALIAYLSGELRPVD